MNDGSRQELRVRSGLLQIEDCLDADGGIALPAGTTLISLIERNIKYVATSWRIATWTTPVRPPDAPWK